MVNGALIAIVGVLFLIAGIIVSGITNSGAIDKAAPHSDTVDHWRWRMAMAKAIAQRVDIDVMGVKAMYVFGSTKNASAVRKTDPILFKLLILSRTIIIGIFEDCLNSLIVFLPNSSIFNFRIVFNNSLSLYKGLIIT